MDGSSLARELERGIFAALVIAFFVGGLVIAGIVYLAQHIHVAIQWK